MLSKSNDKQHLDEDREFSELNDFLSSQRMNLAWKNHLLLEEYHNLRVLVCFYSHNKWVPVTFYPLRDAITLYYKGKLSGTEFFVFPLNSKN